MFRSIALFFLIFSTSLFIANDAFAKRFGGGKSFGMQRSVTSHQSSSFANTQRQAMPSAAPSSTGRFGKWGAALAGLAAGGLLSYLLMGHGIGASMLSWVAIAMVALLVIQFFRQRKLQASTGNQMNQPFSSFESSAPSMQSVSQGAPFMQAAQSTTTIPGFVEDEFLREAKSKFIRLQVAYDQKNIADLREFTTPDVSAEIQLQFNERGATENYTEVVELRAELLEAITEFQVPIASVRFSGQLKEAKDLPVAAFDEVWHFRADTIGRWKVAGIQQ